MKHQTKVFHLFMLIFLLVLLVKNPVYAQSSGISYRGEPPSATVRFDPSLVVIDEDLYPKSTGAQNNEQPDWGVIPDVLAQFKQHPAASPSTAVNPAGTLPSSYDSRSSGIIPPARNQGSYGVCWAFGTMATADVSDIKTNGTGVNVSDHSELALAYFMRNRVPDPLGLITSATRVYDPSGSTSFLSGNNYIFVMPILASFTGPINESLAPYSSASPSVTLDSSLSYLNNDLRLKEADVMYMDHDGASAVKQAIMDHGIVAMSYNHCFENTTTCDYGCSVDAAYYNDGNGGNCGGHAVTVVGWNDYYPASNFLSGHQPSSNGAWLVRNSWGPSWGNNGFFWMSYEEAYDNRWYTFDFAKANAYERLYQYDGSAGSAYIRTDKVANIFTAQRNEIISEISVGSYSDAASGTIKIYTGVTDGNPESGVLASTTSISFAYDGTIFFPLSSRVPLSQGTKFSVVVDLDVPDWGTDANYFYDATYANGSWISFVNNVQARQSFAKDSGGSWYDMSTYSGSYGPGNVRVKALTTVQPDPVTNLSATPGNNSVTLNWTAVSEADGYVINRMNPQTGQWDGVQIGTTSETTFTDTGRPDGSKWQYYVYSYFYLNGSYIFSSGTSVNAAVIPANVTNLTAIPGSDGTIKLNWTGITNADGYTLHRYNQKTGEWNCWLSWSTSTSYTDSNLVDSGQLTYIIYSYITVDGKYIFPSGTSVSVIPYPSNVTNLTATPGNGAVTLNWTAAMNAAGYLINRMNPQTGQWDGVQIATTSKTTFTDTGRPDGSKWTYFVYSYNYQNGNYYFSSGSSVNAGVIPANVTNLNATPGNGSVTLNWTGVPNAEGYTLHRYDPLTDQWHCWLTFTDGTSFTETGLAYGTKWAYIVYSYITIDGKYIFPSGSTINTAVRPAAVGSLNVTKLSISWPAVSNAEGYIIQRKVNGVTDYSYGHSTAASFTDPTPIAGATYFIYSYITVNGSVIYSDISQTELSVVVSSSGSLSNSGDGKVSKGSQIIMKAVEADDIPAMDPVVLYADKQSVEPVPSLPAETEGMQLPVFSSGESQNGSISNPITDLKIDNPTDSITVASISLPEDVMQEMQIPRFNGMIEESPVSDEFLSQIQILNSEQNPDQETPQQPLSPVSMPEFVGPDGQSVEAPSVTEIPVTGDNSLTLPEASSLPTSQPAAVPSPTSSTSAEVPAAAVSDEVPGVEEVTTGTQVGLPSSNMQAAADSATSVTTQSSASAASEAPLQIYALTNVPFWRDDSKHTLPGTGFPSGHLTQLSLKPTGMDYGATGMQIEIPGLDVSAKIVTIPETDGSYPVDWLDGDAGLLEGSYLPGEGVSLLTGHNHLNTMEIGPFLFIRDLAAGDRIYVTKADGELLSYKVYENLLIPADAADEIPSHLKQNALVLITCEDESSEGGYLNRRVVLAEPLK